MNLNDDSLAIFLNRDELQCVMEMLGAQSLVGIDPQLLTGAAPKAGRQSLLSRGLLQAGQPGENDRMQGSLSHLAIAGLFPERALIVIRNVPQIGTQVLIFLHRDETTVLHSMPREDIHRLIELETAQVGIQALTEWFPLQSYAGSLSNAIISSKKIEKFREQAKTAQDKLALKTLDGVQMTQEEKLLLLQAVKESAISGSFALVSCAKDKITSGESLAIVADHTSAWAFTRPEEDTKGLSFRVRRTGADLPAIFSNMFIWLRGAPVIPVDAARKYIRCPKCDAEMSPGKKFCTRCGTALQTGK